MWYRFAAGVTRRPAAVALPVLAVLAFLLLPVAHLHLGINDDRALPASDPARQGAQVLRAAFDGRETSPLQVVATGAPRLNISPAALGSYAARLSAVRGVARVEAPAGTFTAGQQTSGPGPAGRRMRERLPPSPRRRHLTGRLGIGIGKVGRVGDMDLYDG